jgi:hypothetical protein
MAQIDDFKANLLGGGARSNQYRVSINEPSGVVIGLDVRRTSFLCSATSMPSANIVTIPLTFRGRTVNIAGDREPPEAWTTTFYNDTDFMIRNALERWNNAINDFADNTGLSNIADYATDLSVDQLDRDGTVLKSYIFRNAWPKTITAITLNSAETTTIETFDCTWEYQHFEASGVNF